MNTGVISSRYARALLRLTTENGSAAAVYSQVRAMLDNPDAVPSPLEPDLQKFVGLLVTNHREQYLKFIFNSFVSLYLKENNMKLATLTTVVSNPQLEQKIRALISDMTGCGLDLNVKLDPSLIGGFRLVVDDLLLDASVSSQLEKLRRQFIEKTSRIV
ncbi:MAG: F0F1 ATP synthase subunit delta [Bacteroidales bacterium]|jgi:F-type H+-transporting ATPase subunit delta|nr:F0F1 ATP synthase subunit delta [Bacteroidales bacterium]